jgi:5-methylcytosine-specific restriction protein A
MPKKPCSGKFNTCPNLVNIGEKYCPTCAPSALRKDNIKKREAYREYNRTKRNPQVTAWMGSARYKKARSRFLKQNPLCAECAKPTYYNPSGRAVEATVLDHVVPHKGGVTLFWDMSNWQALCRRCHNRKTLSKDGGFGNPIR